MIEVKSGPRKRKVLFVAVGLGFAMALVFVIFSGWIGEPRYQGRRLSEWIDRSSDGPDADQARQAVRAIGKKGVPFYINWITYEERLARRHVKVRKLPPFLKDKWPVKNLMLKMPDPKIPDRARKGFEILRAESTSGIPALVKLMVPLRSGIEYGNACFCLSYAGKDGVAALIDIARRTPHDSYQAEAIGELRNVGYLGWDAAPVIPILVEYINGTNDFISSKAIGAIGRLAQELGAGQSKAQYRGPVSGSFDPALRLLVVSSLEGITNDWAGRAAVIALEACGDSDDRVRRAATNALIKIETRLGLQEDHL